MSCNPPDIKVVRKDEILHGSHPNVHTSKRLRLTPPLISSWPPIIHPPTNCKLIYSVSLWEAARLPQIADTSFLRRSQPCLEWLQYLHRPEAVNCGSHTHMACASRAGEKRAVRFLGECFFLLEKRKSQQHDESVNVLLVLCAIPDRTENQDFFSHP